MDVTAPSSSPDHWLHYYRSNHYEWNQFLTNGVRGWKRPIGIVEMTFDIDGREFEGRADVTSLVVLELKGKLSKDLVKRKVLLAWASLQAKHVLLRARTIIGKHKYERYFVVDVPHDEEGAIEKARQTLNFKENIQGDIDAEDFYLHCLNSNRLVDPSSNLANMSVLPITTSAAGTHLLQFVFTFAHEITDGKH